MTFYITIIIIFGCIALFAAGVSLGGMLGKSEGIKEEKERRREVMEAIDEQAERHRRVVDRATKR